MSKHEYIEWVPRHVGSSSHWDYEPGDRAFSQEAQLEGDLPALAGWMDAERTGATLAGTIEQLRFQGSLFGAAHIQAQMPLLEGSVGVSVKRTAQVVATMPQLSGAMYSGSVLAASMPALTGELEASVPAHASLFGQLPGLSGRLTAEIPTSAFVSASFRMLQGHIHADQDTFGSLEGNLPYLSGGLHVFIESGATIEAAFMLAGQLSVVEQSVGEIVAKVPPVSGVLRATVPSVEAGVLRYAQRNCEGF